MRLDLARSPVDWFLLAVLMFVVAGASLPDYQLHDPAGAMAHPS
jgi:hypothetical protein